MNTTEIVSLIIALVVPIITGICSYLASTSKSKKDLLQLKEQNKLEIEKIINQHQLDLETEEAKHKMNIEKMGLEHKQNLELSTKEMENKLGSEVMAQFISQFMQSPEMKNKMNQTILGSINKKKTH